MITIKDIDEKDYPMIQGAYTLIKEIHDNPTGRFFKYEYDGNGRLLYRKDNVFVIVWNGEDGCYYQAFSVDENYDITTLSLDHYRVNIEGIPHFLDEDTGIYSYIHIGKLAKPDFEGYNGYLAYVQNNYQNHKRVVIQYPYMVSENRKLYPFQIKEPLSIQMINFFTLYDKGFKLPGLRHSYVRLTVTRQDNPTLYEIVTMKDFGLVEYMKNGSFALQKENSIDRYYPCFFSFDNVAITGFPFTRQYKKDDVLNWVRAYGFEASIPDIMIEVFNGIDEELIEYRELAYKMKTVEQEIEVADKEPIILTYGGKHDS